MRRSLTLVCLAALVGCAPLAAKDGVEGDAPIDGAYDSFRSPRDHGAITFGRAEQGELTATEGFHAWTFSLSGPASVALSRLIGSL